MERNADGYTGGSSGGAAAFSMAAESADPAVVIAVDAASLAAEKAAMPGGTAAKRSPIVSVPSRVGAYDVSAPDNETIAANVGHS